MPIAFPDALLTTYLPSGTPAIKATDLNALQREGVRSNRSLRGSNVLIQDEFLGDTLNRSLWAAPPVGAIFVGDDGAAGGFGVAQLGNNGTVGGVLGTGTAYAFGTNDWRLRIRARFPNYASFLNTGSVTMGISVGPSWHIRRTSTQTFNVLITGSPDIDTGVPVPIATHADFEIRREGNLLSYLINDVVVNSQAFIGSMIANGISISTQYTAAAPAGNIQVYVDLVRLYYERQPISAALGSQALGTHAEALTIPFANTNTALVTWNQPFADTSYRLPAPGVLVTTGGSIQMIFQNKTRQGITLLASAAFVGEAYVEAHE